VWNRGDEEEEQERRDEAAPATLARGRRILICRRATREIRRTLRRLRGVSANVRDDGEEARLLDRGRQLSLVSRADATQPAREDLPVVGDEAA
jgi:hypothetical protein